MEKIIIYGKGGIGKSTIASNLSVVFAKQGKRVLHIGCDPKHDSTIRLLGGERIKTVTEYMLENYNVRFSKDLIVPGVHGISCVETGGPPPGVGCGGRAVSRVIEMLQDEHILEDNLYDVVIYDVLGDVVCGGFAAPLKKGMGEKVYIVISEEIMSLYAANKIIAAIHQYSENGIYLGGLILNKRDNSASEDHIHAFSKAVNASIVSSILRSDLIRESEFIHKTVVDAHPESKDARLFTELADCIRAAQPSEMPVILSDREFNNLFV